VDVLSSLVSDGQAAEAIDPGECALDDPAVTAEPILALDAAAGDAGLDVAPAAVTPAACVIRGFVRVQFLRSATGATALAAEWWHRVENLCEGNTVVGIGAGQNKGERDATPIGDDVALRAGLATIRRVRPRRRAPLYLAIAGSEAVGKPLGGREPAAP
jgi:hypothetical protein